MPRPLRRRPAALVLLLLLCKFSAAAAPAAADLYLGIPCRADGALDLDGRYTLIADPAAALSCAFH